MNNNSQTTITKKSVISHYLPEQLKPSLDSGTAFAPSNIALCKYWGKRNVELNLPTNSSLSISLGELGTTTTIRLSENNKDYLKLNGKSLPDGSDFKKKVFTFIDYFRRNQHQPLCIETINTIPTAAGLASSASGFAALTLAINEFFQLQLPKNVLSAFARMGSGSASRSIYSGFVEWDMGQNSDGMDSYATPFNVNSADWCDLRIGIITIDTAEKKINSRDGMNRTIATSSLYQQWPEQASKDLIALKQAISINDFTQLGTVAEHNALSMHATMISAWPPVLYWQAESVAVMHRVWALREQGVEVYFTMDAGPNIKLLFNAKDKAVVMSSFDLAHTIAPFQL